MNKPATKELFETYIIPTYARFPVSFVRGQGAYIYDEDDNSYLDFAAGIAVNCLGHASPIILNALQEQASKFMHCSNLYLNPKQGELAEILTEQVVKRPGRSFFCNSGAEANEALIKLSRRFAVAKQIQNPEVITFHNSFHGRTMGGISATGQEKIQVGFAPLLAGFKYAEFNNLESFKKLINAGTVAILLEIVQGEGGVSVATAEFLLGLQKICQENEILLMVDEVQAGIGRTGKINSWESIFESVDEFQPDAISWAKGLGGGFPIGAVWVKDLLLNKYKVSDLLNPGSHGSTYGGNPLACAVAIAVLEKVNQTDFLAQVQTTAKNFRKELLDLKLPWVKSLRGLGLMIGIEVDQNFIKQQADYTPDVLPSVYIVRKLFAKQMLTVAAGEGVVRLLPPLNITSEDSKLALEKLSLV